MNGVNRSYAIFILLSLLGLLGLLGGCSRQEAGAPQTSATRQDFERGPHGGRLLRDGDFALELQIFEAGVPPEFRVHLFRKEQPLAPDAARVTVQLTRLGGAVDLFVFLPEGAFLRATGVVREPHSFSVAVDAQVGAQMHRWHYESFEGRTRIAARTANEAGLVVEAAGPVTLGDYVPLTGRLVPDAERTRSVAARFPGLIREVRRSVGDTVRAGETLAIIESNESLQTYPVAAPIGGVITERHANPGESSSGPLFVIADYRSLWAELALFPRDLARVKAGQRVLLQASDSAPSQVGRVIRVAPTEGSVHGATSGLYEVRVALDNASGDWTPGLFVEGRVEVAQSHVPLAVRRSGLQQFRDFTVVFERIGEDYEVRMLKLGRQDDTWAEVLDGLAPGARYVSGNSYLVKADIEKSGASHDH